MIKKTTYWTKKEIFSTINKILISLFFALWLEFFYKFGATNDLKNFIGSIPIYFLYLLIISIFLKKFKYKENAIVLFFIFGTLGLLAEWFLIGNSPWSNPDSFQLGMFVFHAVYPTIGFVVFPNKNKSKTTKNITYTFLFFTLIAAIGFLIKEQSLQFAWFIWIPLFPYFISLLFLVKIDFKNLTKIL